MTAPQPEKKPAPQDWHPADVVAALRKAGWSMRRLAVHHGYSPTAFTTIATRPWPRAQAFIAAAIGVDPAAIWPSRYPTKSSSRRAA